MSTQKWSYFRSFWLWEVTKTDVLLLMKWWVEMNECFFEIDTEIIAEIEEVDRVASKVDTILKDFRRR